MFEQIARNKQRTVVYVALFTVTWLAIGAAIGALVASTSPAGGIPAPAIYVVDDPSPNAFATGMCPDRTTVTVTTGLLAIVDREELEGSSRSR